MKKLILCLMVGLFLISLVSGLTVNNVVTNPEEVAPGNDVVIEIELENNLDDDVEDVEVSLVLTSFVNPTSLNPMVVGEIPLSSESSMDYFEEIKEGRKKTARFNLVVDGDADAGFYNLPVILSYLVNGDAQRTVKTFSVYVSVNSKPDFLLNTDGFLVKNKNNELEISITNRGLSKAKFLEIGLGDGGLYDILSQKQIYIGDLDSDDFDSVGFDIYVKDTGSVAIPVTLKYRDALNNEYTESKIVQVKVYSQKEAIRLGLINKSNTLTYFIVIVILVVVWIVYRKIKKRRKRR